MARLLLSSLLFGMLVVSPGAAFAKCDFSASPSPDNPGHGVSINLTLTPGSYGTIAQPDLSSGSSTVSIAPDGTRTIPPNLVVKSDTRDVNRMPKAINALVTGGRGCSFRITLASMSGVSGLRFAPAAGYALSSSNSGAVGVLDSMGQFRFNVGFTTAVFPTSTSPSLGGTITLQVDYN